MEGRQRRSFTDEYKRQAVDLVASSSRSIGSVAKELGLRDSVLRRWVGQRGTGVRRLHWCNRSLVAATLPAVSRGTRHSEPPGGAHLWRMERLCLPQINPEHIGDAVHPGSDVTECVSLPRRHVISARPLPMADKNVADAQQLPRRQRRQVAHIEQHRAASETEVDE